MANHKSAIKRHKQNLKRRLRNHAAKSAVRTTIKKTRAAAASGSKEEAGQLCKQAEKAIAKAASKGMYHKNKAARKISRLYKMVSKV